MRYELFTEGDRICDFSVDCYHSSYWKVVFVFYAKFAT
jgi:hypothetical protein